MFGPVWGIDEPNTTGPETDFLKKAKIPHCKHGILAKYYIKSLQKTCCANINVKSVDILPLFLKMSCSKEIRIFQIFHLNVASVNGHFSGMEYVKGHLTEMGYQSMAILLECGISQWPNLTKMGNQSMAKFY